MVAFMNINTVVAVAEDIQAYILVGFKGEEPMTTGGEVDDFLLSNRRTGWFR